MKLKHVVFSLSLAPLLAHDLYVMPDRFHVKAGQDLTIELHNGDAFPDSEGPPARVRLRGTRIVFNKGAVELKDFREDHKALVARASMGTVGSGSFIITATLTANSREYDAAKFQAYLDDEGLTMVSVYRKAHGELEKPVKELYSKYAKALVVNGSSSNFGTRPIGLAIEIVPAVDPATLKPGESLPVQVLFEGKPMGGLTLETTWTTGAPGKPAVAGLTDANGRISVPLQSGKCRITTGYSQRYRDQAVANWETFFATLTFEMSAPPPLTLIQTIGIPGVEGRMDHMSVDVKGQRLFASGLANGTVEVIDLAAGKRIRTLNGVKEPEGILYVPDMNLIYVADGEGGAVHAFDGESYKLVHTATPAPHADNLRYDPGNQRVYVGFGDGGDGGIGIIDAQQGALIGVINLEGHPESFQFEKPSGRRMFVNVPTAGHIAVIDTGKRRVVEKWAVSTVKSFYPMALDDADQRLFIGSRRPAKLVEFDTKSGQIVTSVDGAVDTDDLFYDGSRKRLYMSGGDGFVSVFNQPDPNHAELLAKVPSGPGARIALFVPELNRFYVAVPRLGKQDAKILVFAVQP